MAYDAENRMTAESQTGFESVRYVYDGQGQRVEKCQSNTAGVCDPAGLQTVSVFDAFGNLAAEYNSGAAIAPPCTTCYLSTDQIGSTRLVTGPGGNVVSRHDYLAFGYDMGTNYGRVNTGLPNSVWGVADGVPEAYTGQVHDDETNFDWFRTRYYTRFQGRFHSPDPFNAGVDLTNPQSWNGYAYVNNNPLSNTDPWGLQDCPAPCSAYSNPGQSPGTPAAGGSGSGGGFTIWQSSNAPPRSKPRNESRTPDRLFVPGERAIANQATTPNGTLSRKTQRHGSALTSELTISAPQSGPSTQPSVSIAPTNPSAAARRAGGSTSPTSAIVIGSNAPPPAPWIARPAMSQPRL
jgi:RHS repeat-associated protein